MGSKNLTINELEASSVLLLTILVAFLIGFWLHMPYSSGHVYSDIVSVYQARLKDFPPKIPYYGLVLVCQLCLHTPDEHDALSFLYASEHTTVSGLHALWYFELPIIVVGFSGLIQNVPDIKYTVKPWGINSPIQWMTIVRSLLLLGFVLYPLYPTSENHLVIS